MQIDLQLSPEALEAIRVVVHKELNSAALSVLQPENSMTIEDVAEFMKVSVGTVRLFLRKGIPHFQSGQVIRFLRTDVISWMRNRTRME